MDIDSIRHTGRFLLLIAIQIIILNQIYFGGYITPYIYPLFILTLPFDKRGWVLLITAFFAGLAVDMFSDSLGMHAAASVLMAFMRPFVIRLISNRADFESSAEPRIDNMGWSWILLYTVLLVFIHHLALFFIEVFHFNDVIRVMARTLLSTSVSAGFIFLAHLLMGKPARDK
jgi:rod shape-determining protein MreD